LALNQRLDCRSAATKGLMICGMLLPLYAAANNSTDQLDELKHMSFEELMNVEVTSVSRHEEPLRDAAAAVAIVTPEIIRRSGATHLPDSLRLVPGIHVGGRHSSSWAVSARGFSSVNSEKLLVLSDTRSIYTPLFSGVAWDVQDYLLSDVERVEVIRGPGATLWGSNAVNGVINITTRSARDTHGSFASAQLGTFDRASLEARYGDETAGGVNYRVFGKYLDREGTLNSTPDTDDAWSLGHLGFRTTGMARRAIPSRCRATRIRATSASSRRPSPSSDARGPRARSTWTSVAATCWRAGSATATTARHAAARLLRLHASRRSELRRYVHTFDIDLQRRFIAGSRHEIVWGLAYRLTSNDNQGKGIFAVDPEESNDNCSAGSSRTRWH
jgi:iron complex outermembrane receptor protein